MSSRQAVAPSELPRQLNLLDATSIVIGTTIGVGIFIVPASIARALPSPPLILATWIYHGHHFFLRSSGVCGARRHDARFRRPVRLPARSLRPVHGVRLRLGCVSHHSVRIDRGGLGGLRHLPFLSAAARSRGSLLGAGGRDRALHLHQLPWGPRGRTHTKRVHGPENRRVGRASWKRIPAPLGRGAGGGSAQIRSPSTVWP